MQDLSGLVCHRIAGSFHWQLKLLGMRLGADRKLDLAGVDLMLTDSGTTLTYLPESTYFELVSELCRGKRCSDLASLTGVIVNNCDPKQFEPVWFQLDRHWYVLPQNAYLVLLARDS